MVNPITPEQLAVCGTEHGNQCALFAWAATQFNVHPELRLMFAIPNGGLRNKLTAARLKAEGVKAGVPDIMLPVVRVDNFGMNANLIYHGLFIELKRPKGSGKAAGREDENQTRWRADLLAQGYCVRTCWGWEQARDVILKYLAGTIDAE